MTVKTDEIRLGSGGEENLLVLLHGLASGAEAFRPVAEYLKDRLPADQWQFILPNASQRRVGVMGNRPVNAWFDIVHNDFTKDEDCAGLAEATQAIDRLLRDAAAEGTAIRRIFVGGFSQGGVLALNVGLTQRIGVNQLDGVFALSAYVSGFTREQTTRTRLPVFFAYGERDEVIDQSFFQNSVQWLREKGFPCEKYVFEDGHTMKSRELDRLADWLTQIAGAKK